MPIKILKDNRIFTIVCPGPSINQYFTTKRIEYFPGNLIAVNGGINTPLNFDYWAVADLECFEKCVYLAVGLTAENWNVYLTKAITLWVPARWEEDLKQYPCFASTVFKNCKKELYPCTKYEDLSESMPFAQGIDWRKFTLLTALALAVKKGAKSIKVYGADLSGDQYFRSGFENERTNLSEERWQWEKASFDAISERCAENGITVTREGVDIKDVSKT